ncbi:MAG: hypothetical protein Barrevirus7_6 [Barrevirus sp.]|uniref:Uncharacterized protein n=1 Tax=Barrevirus sp. TaxID=2487763 RepID=A0A3G4ZU95_9VIRU|nr:MAG: hypothetical protein Barrevirus7_6 [Barrevirus sp.]
MISSTKTRNELQIEINNLFDELDRKLSHMTVQLGFISHKIPIFNNIKIAKRLFNSSQGLSNIMPTIIQQLNDIHSHILYSECVYKIVIEIAENISNLFQEYSQNLGKEEQIQEQEQQEDQQESNSKITITI